MNLESQFNHIVKFGLDADIEDLRTLAGQALEQTAAGACMQHPLGFYHVRLFEQGPVTIRLHYWPAKTRPSSTAVTPYHDHVWSLQSCVLAGCVENVILMLEEDKSGSFASADIQQIDGIDAVVPTAERLKIKSTERKRYFAGARYSIPPRVFHCTEVPIDEPTVTMVRSEVVIKKEGPRTLVPAGYSGQAPKRTYLNESLGKEVLREIRKVIAEAR